MGHRRRVMLCAVVLLSWCAAASAASTNKITQWGISWVFDREYEYGAFANGDSWVVGPVTIVAITPDFQQHDYFGSNYLRDPTQHLLKWINGWQVNPTALGKQGFDETNYEFDRSLVPALPYLAQPGQSIVKAISGLDPAVAANYAPPDPAMRAISPLYTAAVLTVVGAPPPGNGVTVFRPPYVDSSKPYYSVATLRTALLPSLPPPPGDAPSLESVLSRFQRVQLDHKGGPVTGATGSILRPQLNMASSYQPYNAARNNEAALRLMLNDSLSAKMPALIAYVQYGIDAYHAYLSGQRWPDGYGVQPGVKLPLAFAAMLLDSPEMKLVVADETFFWEHRSIATKRGPAIWGEPSSYEMPLENQEQSYWSYIMHPPAWNSTNSADPYGYVDNSMTSKVYTEGYQFCCLSMNYRGAALAALLIPGMKQIWNSPAFFQYADRWVNHGSLSQPDPCAPGEGAWVGGPLNGQRCTTAQDDVVTDGAECVVDPAKYGVTFGPNRARPGDCIRDADPSDGIGRFPTRNARLADQGYYDSAFVQAMWRTYRSTAPLDPPTITPQAGTYVGAIRAVLTAAPSTWRAVTRYTLDGADPIPSSPQYTSPLTLNASTVFKARTFFTGYTPSPVVQAAFTILPDTEKPVISEVITRAEPRQMRIRFSELMDPTTLTQSGNYSIDPSISVLAAAAGKDGRTALLSVSPLSENAPYTLTARNLKDVSLNTILPESRVSFTYRNFDPSQGLTAFWSFNDDAGRRVRDLSGISYSGTRTGTTFAPQGKIGGALRFATAADRVDFELEHHQSHFGIELTNAFTVAFWVNVSGQFGAADTVLGRTIPFTISLLSDGRVATDLYLAGRRSSAQVLGKDRWRHVALTFDLASGARTLYIDGVKDEAGSGVDRAELYFTNVYSFFMGGFNGLLDEVRIYNRALSAASVAMLAADQELHTTAIFGPDVWDEFGSLVGSVPASPKNLRLP